MPNPSPEERAELHSEYLRNRDADDIRIDAADEADDIRFIEATEGEPTISADEVWKEWGLAHRVSPQGKARRP